MRSFDGASLVLPWAVLRYDKIETNQISFQQEDKPIMIHSTMFLEYEKLVQNKFAILFDLVFRECQCAFLIASSSSYGLARLVMSAADSSLEYKRNSSSKPAYWPMEMAPAAHTPALPADAPNLIVTGSSIVDEAKLLGETVVWVPLIQRRSLFDGE